LLHSCPLYSAAAATSAATACPHPQACQRQPSARQQQVLPTLLLLLVLSTVVLVLLKVLLVPVLVLVLVLSSPLLVLVLQLHWQGWPALCLGWKALHMLLWTCNNECQLSRMYAATCSCRVGSLVC
jgi:hypothetical protein